ncbi:MAG: glycoside hydrolase family 30 protein [Armatimonadota bacterium]
MLAVLTSLAFMNPRITSYFSTYDLQNKLRLAKMVRIGGESTARESIEVDPTKTYQTILGFGGTFSENAAYNFKRISPAMQDKVMKMYLDPKEGANWSLLRINLNSCDASSKVYTFDDAAGDIDLKHFSIQPDIDNNMIPSLRRVMQLRPDAKIMASPWSAPAWMKDSKINNHGKLLPEYQPVWADYMVRFVSEYKKNGVPIWCVTPQNEPEASWQKWDAMGWSNKDLGDFVHNHLAPKLRAAHPEVEIIGWDHNKNNLERWAKDTLTSPERKKDYQGIAYHWYEGGEGRFYEPLDKFAKMYPDIPYIANEQGLFGTFMLDAHAAELYATDILENMNHGAMGWIVWGFFFDHLGGPNHAKNPSHTPIMVMSDYKSLIVNPTYYYIAQVSKFVNRGAKRVACSAPTGLLTSAFVNPDGGTVVVVLNKGDNEAKVRLSVGQAGGELVVPPHSLSTHIVGK